jgi:raffinose/stachyose/melibiose transport system substrate-binding protein
MPNAIHRHSLAGLTCSLLALTALTGVVLAQETNLTLLITNAPNSLKLAEGYVADFEAANPDINIDIETRPGGGEGDNIIKTRLATQTMADIFFYNSGSLFQAINPERNLLDLSDEPWQDDVQQNFKDVVSAGGNTYGAPAQAATAGGILYHMPTYEELGLEVPTTWDEFMANNEAIAAAGKVPVIQTYGSTWTSQLFRARRLLQRAGGRTRLRRALHEQRSKVRHQRGGAEGL